MYLNNEGKNRNGNIHYTSHVGKVCDFTFPPFGFILNIDNPIPIIELTNVTAFKHFKKI
jgi:hypothetical protein